jgi:hypothetical protein
MSNNTTKNNFKNYKKNYTKLAYLLDNDDTKKINTNLGSYKLRTDNNKDNYKYFECIYADIGSKCNGKARIHRTNVEQICEIMYDHSLHCKYATSVTYSSTLEKQPLSQLPASPNSKSSAIEVISPVNSSVSLVALEESIKDKVTEDPSISLDELFKWSNENLGKHISRQRLNEIKKAVKKKLKMIEEDLLKAHGSTKEGEIFYRGAHTLKVRDTISKGKSNELTVEKIKDLRYLIWCSEFQLACARDAENYHIDGTFDLLPKGGYTQLVIISCFHIKTNEFTPVCYMLLNSKEEAMYEMCLLSWKLLLNRDPKFKIENVGFTLDFERGLINSITTIFPTSRITGCLFHFKKRLFEKGREIGLLKSQSSGDFIKLTIDLGKLCWSDDYKKDYKDITEKWSKKMDAFEPFFKYFCKNWLDRFETLLNYRNIKQQFRSNAILEGYNNIIQSKIKKYPTMLVLINGLKEEENTYLNQVLIMTKKNLQKASFLEKARLYLPKEKRDKTTKESNEMLDQKAKKRKYDHPESRQDDIGHWLQWKENSCYIDSILTLYYFFLFSMYDFSTPDEALEYNHIMDKMVNVLLTISKEPDKCNTLRDTYRLYLDKYKFPDLVGYGEIGPVDPFLELLMIYGFMIMKLVIHYECKRCKDKKDFSELLSIPAHITTSHLSYLPDTLFFKCNFIQDNEMYKTLLACNLESLDVEKSRYIIIGYYTRSRYQLSLFNYDKRPVGTIR